MTTEFTISPIGLLTQANKLGIYPQGAMSRADGLAMRAPGKLTPLPLTALFITAPVIGTFTTVCAALPLGTSKILMIQSTSGQPNATNYYLGDSVTAALTTITRVESQVATRARSRNSLVFRGKLFSMTTTGLMVLDALDGSITAYRWAQVPQPYLGIVAQAGESIDAEQTVGYSAVISRKQVDGYELVGAPSPVTRAKSGASPVSAFMTVYMPKTPAGRPNVAIGDIVTIFRTKQISSPFSTPGNYNPGTTVYAIGTHVLTSGDVSSGQFNFEDKAQANQIVGRELYSNPGQETLQSVRFIPPVAKCVAEFNSFVFYANITEPGSWSASWPGGSGDLPALSTDPERLNGVGSRAASGTFTSGTNTITAMAATVIGGLVPGMFVFDGGVHLPFPTFLTITAVGVNTITLSGNTIGTSGIFPFFTADALEVDGVNYVFDDLQGLLAGIGGLGSNWYQVVTDEPLPSKSTGELSFGQRIQMVPYRATQNSYGMTIRGTHGVNYDPPIPEYNQAVATFVSVVRKNLLKWCWEQQPESVSPSTFAFIGSGEIYALATTRDVMWIFTETGLWRFTGYGTRPSGIQANFRVDLIDRTLILAGPNAFCVLRDAVFAYTNIGLVKISDAVGVQPISRGRIGDLLPGRYWVEDDDVYMTADELIDEIWLNINTGNFEGGTGVSDCFIWSEQYGVFTKLGARNAAPTVLQTLDFDRFQGKLALGVGGSTTGASTLFRFGTTYNAWTADFQPQYGPDPVSSKQWGEMTVMCDPASAGKQITPRFNDIAYGSNPLVQYPQQNDSRAFYGVSIEAPAVANTLAPGISGAAEATITELRGIAMKYDQLSEEKVFR